ncbi:hypothetical protein ACFQV8_30645 [Pseudonocardia benzenivorans]
MLPSRTEAFGMVVREATARAIPVLATDAGVSVRRWARVGCSSSPATRGRSRAVCAAGSTTSAYGRPCAATRWWPGSPSRGGT